MKTQPHRSVRLFALVVLMLVGLGANSTTPVAAQTSPPLPTLISPNDGHVFRNYPRTATLSWTATPPGYPGYNDIEVQVRDAVVVGDWSTFQSVRVLSTTSFTINPFPGDNMGRWRVSGVYWLNTKAGWRLVSDPATAWRYFSFNTGAYQYDGMWYNDDATAFYPALKITTYGQELTAIFYYRCGTSYCYQGTGTTTAAGEPISLRPDYGGPSHVFSFYLDNNAGTHLAAADIYTSTTSYPTFHR